uniref:Uncharacterized protein n=1 Tax=viral metagenome TaxID=1070528 RepID=A0A6M3XZZ1_9ZZZZ
MRWTKWTREILIQYLRDDGFLAKDPKTTIPDEVEKRLPSILKKLNKTSLVRKCSICGYWEDKLLKKTKTK